MPKLSMLDAVKIQATAVIPIVKALEAEIGKQRAHTLVRDAIAESYAAHRARQTAERNTHPGAAADMGFPVESEVVEHTETSYGFDITGCAFADHFRKIGEPEIGALLTCGVDFAVEKTLRPEWEFQRTRTRMQGADTCDFRWRRRG